MARALTDIITELNSVYNPQRDSINKRVGELDPMQQAEEKGLEAAKQDAFTQITDQANRRGLFYSGIPIAEEQKYTGSTFLPAVANLRAKYKQQRWNLEDALNKIQEEQYSKAYSIRDSEIGNENAAAAARNAGGAGGFAPSFGGGSVLDAGSGYGMQRKQDGSYAFVDSYGNPVSAATYSAVADVPFRQLLQKMASSGDKGALQALQFVGDDYRYDPGKINASAPYRNSNQSIYNALTWGSNVNNSQSRARAQGGGGGGW